MAGRVGPRRWKGDLHEGEPVEYIGPPDDDGWLLPGDRGRLITPGELGDPPPSWVVSFRSTTAVFPTSLLRSVELPFTLRMAEPADRRAVAAFLEERSSARVARLGQLIDPLEHPALVAEQDGRLVGVLTYVIDGDECEVLTLHVADQWRGIGSALLREVEWIARGEDLRRIWLITTNDNLDALRFYQRKGFELAKLYAGGIARDRPLKPEIPAIGEYGIFINDELELDKLLKGPPRTWGTRTDPSGS